jgi:hypothetical protein
MKSAYNNQLQKVIEIQKTLKGIHPFLQKAFPLAVAEGDHFLIYDLDPAGEAYRLIQAAPVPMPVPPGVRAAFPLDSYHGRTACIVTGEVFDEIDGYVTIFHEFIHCKQAETCEPRLRQTLAVARKAQAAGDMMWEINHPFLYALPEFVRTYAAFLAYPAPDEAKRLRQQLRVMLPVEDYEYMVWQEWKEGFARYIENQVRRRLGIPENHNGRNEPFDRVSFYAGGSIYIHMLGEREEGLLLRLDDLFERMLQGML